MKIVLGYIKKLSVLSVVCILITLGCNHDTTVEFGSNLCFEPGLGVRNVCEIGMTLSQIKKGVNSVSTFSSSGKESLLNRWKKGRYALIPSLSAVTFLGTNQPISIIDVYVVPFESKSIPGLKITQPFIGKIKDGPSFEERDVTRTEVESIYGVIDCNIQDVNKSAETLLAQKSYYIERTDGVVELWYLDQGVAFITESNVVTSFKIVPKKKEQNGRGPKR